MIFKYIDMMIITRRTMYLLTYMPIKVSTCSGAGRNRALPLSPIPPRNTELRKPRGNRLPALAVC